MKLQTETELQQWRRWADRQMTDPGIILFVELAVGFLAGFMLGAAGLGNVMQPFSLAVLCAGLPGWLPMSFAIGGSLGYWAFWGQAGVQGIAWIAAGLPVCVLLRDDGRSRGLLRPSLAAFIVAFGGLIFQIRRAEHIAVGLYLLRIGLAFGATCLAQIVRYRRRPGADALAIGIGMLAMVQIAPIRWLNLGFITAGVLVLWMDFPAVALTGLALDLAGIVPVPMTAVLCLAYLAGRVPFLPRRFRALVPGLSYLAVMGLCGRSDWSPVPALILGGMGCLLLPKQKEAEEKPAAEHDVQDRLESVAAVLAQTKRLLQSEADYPPDEGALIARAADRACEGCELRKKCRAAEKTRFLPNTLLHRASITGEDVPENCKQKERLLDQLQHSREQYRLLLADRQRQQEYRNAVMQQYGFLAEYLQALADGLFQTEKPLHPGFRPEVAACSRGREEVNGDRCCWFTGIGGHYYVLICDGMGTGDEAAYEAKLAGTVLRRMLSAGYPADKALQSLNSLCILRGSAGAVSVDLAEADLTTGRATLYKWGAAPSWLLNPASPEKIGQECLPPGISLEEGAQTVDRVILHSGVALLMVSDGVDAESAVAALEGEYDQPAGFLAALVLENGRTEVPDDATAVVLRLHRLAE